MQQVFLLYTCDGFLSTNSMRLLGVYSTKEKAILAARKDAKDEEKVPLTKWEREYLERYNQTQGRETNYLIDPQEVK